MEVSVFIMQISYKSFVAFIFTLLLSSNGYALSPDIKVLSDVAYGKFEDQKLDIYIPNGVSNAPIIFMVHGGAWRVGDKSAKAVVRNKVNHWVKKGFIFISTNYRMLPNVRPVEQAKDIEAALIFSQKNARTWGGSSSRFILMGHSAGAHLVSLVSANFQMELENDIKPWLATIAIDSAAFDIVKTMSSANPPRFYKKAFGDNLDYWQAASPLYSLKAKLPPFLAICSLKRKDNPCDQAENFVDKAQRFGSKAQLLTIDLSHRGTNVELGKSPRYTKNVDDFLKKVHPSFDSILRD
jgi:acetyl esterase/lipase